MQAQPIKLLTAAELAVVSVPLWLAFSYHESVGLFTRHMLMHIVLMMLVAPALADLARKRRLATILPSGSGALSAAALLQGALFCIWHSPPGLTMAGQDGLASLSLLFSALWFWLAVFDQAGKRVWRSVFALLLSGKLFCLIAILLTFAPRVLYGPELPIALADQQLAGLLMLTACPLTYVIAAIVLVYRWFQRLGEAQAGIADAALAPEHAA